MFKNHLNTALRNLWRNKFFTFINIIGLAIGLAGSFFLLLYIISQTGYNTCHENRNNIYRILKHSPEFSIVQPNVPFQMGEVLSENFAEVKKASRYRLIYGMSAKKDDQFIEERYVFGADPTVFDIFTLPVISGNKDIFLRDPSSIVISRLIAEKYFPGENAVGRELVMQMDEEEFTFRVDGVMENIPHKSTFRAEILCHTDMIWERSKKYFDDKNTFLDWSGGFCEIYVLLPDKYSPKQLENKLPAMVNNYIDKDRNVKFTLQALNDIYFNSQHLANARSWGDLQSIYNFTAIAVLILLIACANYIILSTAQSMTRFKEIGIRKVLGANRMILIRQILTESVLISFIAIPVSLLIMEFSLSFVNDILGVELKIWDFSNWKFFIGLATITIIVGLLSGSYVSVFLSRYNPTLVFQNTDKLGNSKSWFRSAMIILQIVAFSVLIIVLQTISSQIDFTQNSDMGYDKENLLKIHIDVDSHAKVPAFLHEIKSNPNIINASAANYTPPELGWQKMQYLHPSDPTKKIVVEEISATYNFTETIGLKIQQGPSFSKDFALDAKNAAIISETAIKEFGLTNPLGSTIHPSEDETLIVIGVINDINIHTLKSKFTPLVLRMTDVALYEIVVRFAPGTQKETIEYLEEKFSSFIIKTTRGYMTAKEYLGRIYWKEFNFKKILTTFTLLAIFISIIGLFALSLFMVKQKTKVIGIRKVFGATVKDIIRLFVSEFLIMVLIANFIAWPLGWYFADRWLEQFAFRITLPIHAYLLALILSLVLVIATVTINAVRAANANPVDSLRYE